MHAAQIRRLVDERGLNRELEALPTEEEIGRRAEAGVGLTSPELATLMAHVKLALKAQVAATDLPDQEVFAARLPQYFPSVLRRRFDAEIRSHQLRPQIVTTMLVNDVVDTAGITYADRVTEDTGVGLVDAVRAYVAIDAIFGSGFSAALQALPDGEWAGPVNSSYGPHLVMITERNTGGLPPLDQIRDRVEAEWRATKAQEIREAFGQDLKDRYQVVLPPAAQVVAK